MTAAETSIEAYRDHRTSGRLGDQARSIVEFLAVRTGTDWSRGELADTMRLRLSSVCGRVNELLASGHIEVATVRPCRMTGKRVETVRLRGLF